MLWGRFRRLRTTGCPPVSPAVIDIESLRDSFRVRRNFDYPVNSIGLVAILPDGVLIFIVD